jgi:hypothetical protein
MKKLITVAVVTVVGFFAFHASADGIRTLEVINFDLVYQPQGNDTYTTNTSGTILNNILGGNIPINLGPITNIFKGLGGNIPILSGNVTNYIYTEHKGKAFRVTSKDIITLIEAAFETNFPSGSKLAFYGDEIVIVDSTGANVIFYPDETTPPNSSESGFYFEMTRGIEWGTDVLNSQGVEKQDYTQRSIIHIYLYNYPNIEVGLAVQADLNTAAFDLAIGGLITRHYSSTNNNFSLENFSSDILVGKSNSKLTGLAGEGSIGDQYGILTGSATGHGSGNDIPK